MIAVFVIIAVFSYVFLTIESNMYMTLAAKIAMQKKRYDISDDDMHSAKDAYRNKNEFTQLISDKDRRRVKWIRRFRLSIMTLFILYLLIGLTATRMGL